MASPGVNLPSLPGAGGAPAPGGPQGSPDVGAMVGPPPEGEPQGPTGPGPNAEDAARNVMMQFRTIISGVEDMSRQFPQAAEEARKAKAALSAMMAKISGSLKGPEAQPHPRVAG